MTTPEPTDERRRRRVVVFWVAAGVALALVASAVLALGSTTGRDSRGAASSPVLGPTPTLPGAVPTSPAPTAPAAAATTAPANAVSSSAPVATTVLGSSGGPDNVGIPPYRHGKRLTMSSTLSAPLRPGVPRTLHVTIRNPNSFAVALTTVAVQVRSPHVAGCLASWVTVGSYHGAAFAGRRVGARGTTVVDLPITLVNLVSVSQNACKHAVFPLGLSAVATKARS